MKIKKVTDLLMNNFSFLQMNKICWFSFNELTGSELFIIPLHIVHASHKDIFF